MRAPRAPIAPIDPRGGSPALPWAWLLFGLLLGTGGTLLTSTFWLPERQSSSLPDTVADDPALVMDGEAVAAVRDPAALDPKDLDHRPGDDAEGQPEVVDIAPDVENIDPELAAIGDDALESQLPTDGERALDFDQTELADRSEPLLDVDASSPSRNDAVVDESEKQAAAGGPESLTDEQEQEVPLEAPASVSPEPLDIDVADEIDRRQPAPQVLAERAGDGEASSVEEPPQETAAATPSNGADPDDLPPRIRQALRSADAGPADRTEADGSNRARVYRVQLAAVNDEAAARTYWREANERLPGIFTDVEPVFDQRVVEERLYLRIWVGAFDSRIDAVGYCDWLKEQGQDCFVTRTSDL